MKISPLASFSGPTAPLAQKSCCFLRCSAVENDWVPSERVILVGYWCWIFLTLACCFYWAEYFYLLMLLMLMMLLMLHWCFVNSCFKVSFYDLITKKTLVFTLSGHFADPLSNVRKTFGSTSCLSLTDEMMKNRSSFELQAQPKHVSVILCSGDDPEFAPLKLKRNTRPLSCSLRKKEW